MKIFIRSSHQNKYLLKILTTKYPFCMLFSNQSIVKILASIVEDVKSDLSCLLDALMTPKEFTGLKLNMLD